MRRLLLAGLLATLVAGPSAAAEEPVRRAVVISVDGLMPDAYQRADDLGLALLNLRRLMAEGVSGRVQGVLPTVTYPSHTTLVTGVPPRLHGIVANRIFDPLGTSNEAWYWYAGEIRVPTLVSAARQHGLITATVSWPVSVGLGSDYNLPEYWRSGSKNAADLALIEQLSTPGLLAEVAAARGRPFAYPPTDADRTDIALYVLERHRPQLLLLHLFEHDLVAHDFGPMSTEAVAALEASDQQVGRVLAALDRLGLAATTLVAVVSDHGFLPVEREIRPNTLLRDAGLIQLDAAGNVMSWRAFFHGSGGSAALHLAPGEGGELVRAVDELFRPRLADPGWGLARLLDRDQSMAFGAPAEVALTLEARPGFLFKTTATGEWSRPSAEHGAHGFAPDRRELHAALILTAPGLGRRGDLGLVPMTAIAPTVAAYLGIDLSPAAAAPLDVIAGAGRRR